MEGSFFISWQLWEQMSFVLGVAIVVVFMIGYAKLWWMQRYVKARELVDEEKRLKIQELRQSGMFVEADKSQDVPFGVRAIESGIQVDGIWISRSGTPTSEHLEFLRKGLKSTTSLATSSDSDTQQSSITFDSQQTTAKDSFTDIPLYQLPPQLSKTHSFVTEQESAAAPSSIAGKRPTYKPGRSSMLRYSSYEQDTQYDVDTLHRLEGSSARVAAIQVHNPARPGSYDAPGNSSPESTTDEEDSSTPEKPRKSISAVAPRKDGTNSSIARVSAALSGRKMSRGVYAPVPLNPQNLENIGRYSTQDPPKIPDLGFQLDKDEYSAWLSIQHQNPFISFTEAAPLETKPNYGPGELHANKLSRQINSGFEVLPAGTFNTHVRSVDSDDLNKQIELEEGRQTRKLQKRDRSSARLPIDSVSSRTRVRTQIAQESIQSTSSDEAVANIIQPNRLRKKDRRTSNMG